MPTYEYRCEACGNEWEAFQSITAEPIRKCPQCAKNKARRLISTGAGLIFKGSGFYLTDYARANGKKSESGASTPKENGKSETTKKTETPSAKSNDSASSG